MFSISLRIDLRGLFLHTLDGRDVVGAESELRGDLRVVHEVHVRRRGRHAASERDEHVVGPDDPARLRDDPLELRVAEVDDVARPRHARREVARRERLRVVVAVELADLARVHRRLQRGERPIEGLVRDLRGVVAVLQHDEAEGVAHLAPDADLALQLRILEELLHARHGAGDVLVPGDPVHAGEPRQRVVAVGVEGRARLHVDEVRDVRDEALVQLQGPAVVEVLAEEPVVVGGDDDVATDPLSLASRPWTVAKYSGFPLMSS